MTWATVLKAVGKGVAMQAMSNNPQLARAVSMASKIGSAKNFKSAQELGSVGDNLGKATNDKVKFG